MDATTYGVFTAERCLDNGFRKLATAEHIAAGTPGAYAAAVCPHHTDCPADNCLECALEYAEGDRFDDADDYDR